jgi:hypothetical protein
MKDLHVLANPLYNQRLFFVYKGSEQMLLELEFPLIKVCVCVLVCVYAYVCVCVCVCVERVRE